MYGLDVVVKDRRNYDFPCKFARFQFVEIEVLSEDLDSKKMMHYKQVKKIVKALDRREGIPPFKQSTLGKLISRTFNANCTRVVFGNYVGKRIDNEKNFKKFLNQLTELMSEKKEKIPIFSQMNIKTLSILGRFKK